MDKIKYDRWEVEDEDIILYLKDKVVDRLNVEVLICVNGFNELIY